MGTLHVRDARQIRSLASPLRQLVLDTLEAVGPCSVAGLAAAVGVPSDRLYYHLRALERVELVRAGRRVRGVGRPGTEYAAAGRRSRIHYAPGDRANVAAVSAVAGGMTRAALREFRRALTSGAVVSGGRRNLWAARRVAWLAPGDLQAVNQALVRLFALFERRRSSEARARPQAITIVLAPLVGRRQRHHGGTR